MGQLGAPRVSCWQRASFRDQNLSLAGSGSADPPCGGAVRHATGDPDPRWPVLIYFSFPVPKPALICCFSFLFRAIRYVHGRNRITGPPFSVFPLRTLYLSRSIDLFVKPSLPFSPFSHVTTFPLVDYALFSFIILSIYCFFNSVLVSFRARVSFLPSFFFCFYFILGG
ncbi:hypothetical protein OG21DRAFT_150756 [Imleria badia]|nr:hypothetical protein OG21DRAFT_150756 [Imleria badia]